MIAAKIALNRKESMDNHSESDSYLQEAYWVAVVAGIHVDPWRWMHVQLVCPHIGVFLTPGSGPESNHSAWRYRRIRAFEKGQTVWAAGQLLGRQSQ